MKILQSLQMHDISSRQNMFEATLESDFCGWSI
jgi:hypothetical protein